MLGLEIRDLKVGQRSLFLRARPSLRHMQITLSLFVCETSPGSSVELQVAPMHLDYLVNVFGNEDHTVQRCSRTPWICSCYAVQRASLSASLPSRVCNPFQLRGQAIFHQCHRSRIHDSSPRIGRSFLHVSPCRGQWLATPCLQVIHTVYPTGTGRG
jgi:hypothetical protein